MAKAERRPHAAIVVLALLTVTALAAVPRWSSPHLHPMLGTDEADYVRAMAYGAGANYLGTRERSGFAFVLEVIDEYRRTGWARPFQRDWDAGDAAGLRHYHPPLALYPVGVLAAAGERDERTLRLASAVTGVLACLASALLAFVLLAGAPPYARVAGMAAAGLVTAASPYHLVSSATIAPHAAFSLLSTLALVGLTRAVQTGREAWWLGACAALGLSVLTVPYWALLVPAMLWVWWWGLPTEYSRRRAGVRGLAAAAGAAVVAWPPALFEAGLVKPVLMYGGIVLRPLGRIREPGGWMLGLVAAHPVILVLLVIGAAGLYGLRRSSLRTIAPAALFVAGFLVLNLRVGHMKPLYISDVIAPLAALATALVGMAILRLPARVATPVLLAAALLAAVQVAPATGSRQVSGEWRQPLATLNSRLAGQRVLVTPRAAGAMVVYYLPDVQVVLDSNHPLDLEALEEGLRAGRIGTVLRWGSRPERNGAAGPIVSDRPPDGTVVVGATPVSWWQVRP